MQPFSQLTEDHIFGAEFDKIRETSGSSISGIRNNEDSVINYTEISNDPFESAPFRLPSKLFFNDWISLINRYTLYLFFSTIIIMRNNLWSIHVSIEIKIYSMNFL